MRYDRKKLAIFGVSTLSGVVVAIVILMLINASFLKVPVAPPPLPAASAAKAARHSLPPEADYASIMRRNLFRAKLQVEMPKQKTPQEIEEEALTGIVKKLALKGVMLGRRKQDTYAVIDRGGPKGVYVYGVGEVVEDGLALKEISKDSVKLEKGDFQAVIRLFSSAFERTGAPVKGGGAVQQASLKKPVGPIQPGKDDIKREGSITRISKSLAEKMKANTNLLMSSIAVKPGPDGIKVVAVDAGSLAQKMGIAPDDTLQEVNGHQLSSAADMNAAYEALKNATRFDVKVLRRGKSETLHYEIR